MEKKLFCVILTNQEEWDNPHIYHVMAEDREKAGEIAILKIGYDPENFGIDEAVDFVVLEVSDIDVLEEE